MVTTTTTAGMQMLRQIGSRPGQPLLLLLLLLLLLATLNITAAKTENRPIEQYEHSGYSYWKLIWRGVRTSPGSLWYSYFFYALATALSLLYVTSGRKLIGGPWSLTLEAADLYVNNLMAGMLFYVSLAVTQLSDLMEAYLVALCSIQLALDTQRCVHSTSWLRNLFGTLSLLLAVWGIILLDSYHPLNVHYDIYSVVVSILVSLQIWASAEQYFEDEEEEEEEIRLLVKTSPIVLSVCHFVFLVAAFALADKVEGSHRGPMLAYLCTAAVYFIAISIIQWVWPYPSHDIPRHSYPDQTPQVNLSPHQTPQAPWAPDQALLAPCAPDETPQEPHAPDQTPQQPRPPHRTAQQSDVPQQN